MKISMIAMALALLTTSEGLANQFAINCSGTLRGSSKITVVGVFKQGGFWHQYRFAGALQVDNNNATPLQAARLQTNQSQTQIFDIGNNNDILITLPFALGAKLPKTKTDFPSVQIPGQSFATFERLAGQENPAIDGGKLLCTGSSSYVIGDKADGLFAGVSESLINFLGSLKFGN